MKYFIIFLLLTNTITCSCSELGTTAATFSAVQSLSTETTNTRAEITKDIKVEDKETKEPKTLDQKHPHLMKLFDSMILIFVLKLTACLI